MSLPTRPLRILLVDDAVSVRRLIRLVIAGLGADIAECDDGADAVEAYERHAPDVVLMDLFMPRVDGLTATRQLLARFADARIIVVTNCGDEDVQREARACGALDVVSKKDLTGLDEAVRRAVGG